MAKIAQLCEGWASWLAEHFPAALNTFQQGASADEITAFEHEIGFKLPDDVRAWFGWRDGQLRFPDCNILFGFEVLSIDAAVEEWKDWQQYQDMNQEVSEWCTSRPVGSIVPAYTTPGWIPLAQWPATSNYLGIDMNPGPQGTIGQVINFGRDEMEKCVAGSSLAAFIEFLLDELESENVVVDETQIRYVSHTFGDLGAVFTRLHDQGCFDGRRLRRTVM